MSGLLVMGTAIAGTPALAAETPTAVVSAESQSEGSADQAIFGESQYDAATEEIGQSVSKPDLSPSGATSASDFAFSELKDGTLCIISYLGSGTTVDIPASINGKKVTTVSAYLFADESLEYSADIRTVNLPATVTDVGFSPLHSDSLTQINVASANPTYTSRNGVLYTRDMKTLVKYPSGRTDQTFEIPAGVTVIGSGAFSDCKALTSVKLPDTVTTISDSSFYDCRALAKISFPKSLTEIGPYAFEYCEKLNDVDIPSGVTTIGASAFGDCFALSRIAIPDSVSYIGEYAFANTLWLRNQPEGLLYAGKVLLMYNGKLSKNTTVTVKSGTKGIASFAFMNSAPENLTGIKLPDSLTTIAQSALTDCTSLKTVELPANVCLISNAAFLGCTGLEKVTIHNRNAVIRAAAFSRCDRLTLAGYSGSTTQTYAKENSIPFVSISEQCATPMLRLSNSQDGVKISWDKVAGAAQYRVYYKGSKGWTKLGDTTSDSMIDYDVVSGTNYTYTIRALDKNGNHISDYYRDGFKIKFIKAPTVSLSNEAEGVKISWDKIGGAEKYRVFYYGSKGWTRLTTTSNTSFVDTDVRSGSRYTYTVRCVDASGETYTSNFRAGKAITWYTAPSLTLKNAEDGVKISWNKVSGAAKYRVYYKGSKGWTKLCDTASTSTVDLDVKSGTTYTYTIRALDKNGNHISGYYRSGFKIKFIKAPTFKLSNASNGVKISWSKVGGAEKYRVFYYGSKGWTRLADTSGTSFLDTDVRSGSRYKYTVRCITADGKAYTSDYRAGQTITFK